MDKNVDDITETKSYDRRRYRLVRIDENLIILIKNANDTIPTIIISTIVRTLKS